MRLLLLTGIASILFLTSCKKNPDSTESDSITVSDSVAKSGLEMYQLSEMSLLMELMYADNTRIKNEIAKGNLDLGEIPSFYTNIEKAILTDPSDRDLFFNSRSKDYLEAQSKIYEDPENIITNFNNMVNSCIECHMVKCAGPIDRIKKLFIL